MRSVLLILFSILTCNCGDNLAPAPTPDALVVPDAKAERAIETWYDAWHVWGDAWCELAARCEPEDYATHFPDGMAECVEHVVGRNCAYTGTPCSLLYDEERLVYLERCHEVMSQLACGVTEVPTVCLRAFL